MKGPIRSLREPSVLNKNYFCQSRKEAYLSMISIVIPTYNEAQNIKVLLERISKSIPVAYEVVIIDDNSPDGTGSIAEGLTKEYPLRIIHRSGKLGLSSAVIDGFKAASGDLICVMDSDLSHPPEVIPSLLNILTRQDIDIAIASRFAKGGGVRNWPKRRLLNTRTALLTVKLLTPVKDPMSGFFLLKRSVIENVKLVPRGYKILLEILIKGRCKRVKELPFIFENRVYGKSKLNLNIYLEFAAQLVDLYFYKIKNMFYPVRIPLVK
ncbi:MAG: polyprenol monophosphomannose synthase [Candidatus Omnitrophota bacterium]